ncbi:hypothetical protein [Actinacidiphila oryziradicis]|nr:hypothetical protein [Actinacidiphila oryziradicis]
MVSTLAVEQCCMPVAAQAPSSALYAAGPRPGYPYGPLRRPPT